MRRFEYSEGSSNKFWEIEQDGADLRIRWGRIGTAGQSQTKSFGDEAKAATALTRLVTDEGTEFDRLPPGYDGPIYAEICPRSFSVLVRPGMRLNQLRLRQGQAVLSDDDLRTLLRRAVAEPRGLGGAVELVPEAEDALVRLAGGDARRARRQSRPIAASSRASRGGSAVSSARLAGRSGGASAASR